MSSYEILIKCGYSREEAARISSASSTGKLTPSQVLRKCGFSSPEQVPPSSKSMTIAEQNEAKYADLPSVRDQVEERIGGGINARYLDIRSGSDNGDCTTRRGTYRKLKTGDGRFAVKPCKCA